MANGSRTSLAAALVAEARRDFEEKADHTGVVAPISPSPADLIDTVLEKLQLDSRDVVLDLGCGDGRWLIAAALRGCSARGFDLNEDLLQRGRRDAIRKGVASSVELLCMDIYDAPLVGCAVIVVYLFREGLSRMKKKLEAEADPGSRIVSIGFHIRGWASLETISVGKLHAYIYRLPDRAS